MLVLLPSISSQMNPATESDALNLAIGFCALVDSMEDTCAVDDHEGCTEVVLFPPFPFISKVKDIVQEKGITVGAQQVYYEDKGAFTGSVAASMVKSVGCEYVLCGHSERRTLFSDSDVNINAKVKKVSLWVKQHDKKLQNMIAKGKRTRNGLLGVGIIQGMIKISKAHMLERQLLPRENFLMDFRCCNAFLLFPIICI